MLSKQLCAALIAALLVPTGLAARAAVFLSDDFNDNSLDASKWFTALPFIDSKVLEQNQRIEMTARGYLITQAQSIPSQVNPLVITGQYTFNNVDPNLFDFLDITTRTSATPGSGPAEVTNGISFTMWGTGNIVIIDRNTNTQIGPSGSFTAVAGQPYNFTVTDNGFNVSISVSQGGPVLGSTFGTTSTTNATNRIAFYNREFSSDTGYLDNVAIQTIPEPGALAPLLLVVSGSTTRRTKSSR
jgi:hypothetical protein